MIFALEGKTGMRDVGSFGAGKGLGLWSWGVGEFGSWGVVELVTHVHVHVQIVGPRGMGRFMQVFYFYIFLPPSFLPSCARRTTPFSQIHVQYLT